MKNAVLRGKPDAGKPYVRFDEGEVAPAKPRREALLYKRLIAMAAVLLEGFLFGADSAKNYVQDGLVGLWDAEENAGWALHENNPSIWKNLVDESVEGRVPDFQLSGAGTFEEKAFHKAKSGLMATNVVTISTNCYFKTVEVVVSDVPVGKWAVPFWGYNEHCVVLSDSIDSSTGVTNRLIHTSYFVSKSLKTPNCPKVASISVLYTDSYSSYFKKQTVRATDAWQGGVNTTMVNGGLGNSLNILSVGGIAGSADYASVTGYRVHSIRLYNRVLTDSERQLNMLVDNARFGARVYKMGGDATWTGEGGDGKFSNGKNWDSGHGILDNVPYDRIVLKAQGQESLENDVGVITANCLHVEQAVDPTLKVTVSGKPFVLLSPYHPNLSSDVTLRALRACCPLTMDTEVTFAGATACSQAERDIVYNKAVNILATADFAIKSVNKATHTFNGPVIAPHATFFTYGGQSDYFNGPVTATLLHPGNNSSLEYFHFSAPGGSWAATPYFYGGIYAKAENVFPTNLVFRWVPGGYNNKDVGSHFYRLEYDQTCDRMESAAIVGTGNGFTGVIRERNRIVSEVRAVTLTLNGTANATHYGRLSSAGNGRLNLVWNPVGDFTQAIGDIAHTMQGTLTVKGGTLASIGTNNFPNVTTLYVKNGATFAVRASDYNAAANPFPGTTTLELSGSGKVEVAAGVTMTVDRAFLDGVLITSGTYQRLDGTDETATKVDWVTGDGLLLVKVCDGTSWKNTGKSGYWNDAENWSHGMPDGTKSVYLTAEKNDYTVTMTNADVWPSALVIRGENTKLLIAQGHDITYDGSGRTASVSIEEGGILDVAGSLVLTNYQGTFTIGSTTSATSRFHVSGVALYAIKDSSYAMYLNEGGELETVDKGLLTLVKGDWSQGALRQRGGTVHASGNSTLCLSGKDKSDGATTYFRTGATLFSDSATLKNFGSVMQVAWGPRTAGESLEVAFRDHAAWRLATDGVNIGTADANTLVDFDSDGTHSKFTYRIRVCAAGTGTAQLRISKGFVNTGDGRGIDIADDNNGNVETHGKLVVRGGWLCNMGSNGAWSDQGKQNGFTVGYGANATVESGCVAFGESELSSGTNQTVLGVTLVGVGYGKGVHTQTGGVYLHDSASQIFGVGAAGGEGHWVLSNGLMRVNATAYVGGFFTNVLEMAHTMKRWPIERHAAQGMLTVAGGTADFRKNLILGADGRGIVNVMGSAATFTVGGDFVFSNCVENAASGGTLNFVLDAQGVTPLQVGGKVSFQAGAALHVDLRNYARKRSLWLIKANEFANPIDPADISVTGATGFRANATVVRTAAGYRLEMNPGTCVIFR